MSLAWAPSRVKPATPATFIDLTIPMDANPAQDFVQTRKVAVLVRERAHSERRPLRGGLRWQAAK
jgi:hypothetical protein